MTNFRKLCDELLDELRYQTDWSTAEELKERASAALDEPEPEGPTKDELWELWLRLNNELPDRPAAVAEFWEHARVHALARWGK